MKIIQCLTVMMAVMVYAASPHFKEDLLKEIHDEAERVYDHMPSDVYVAKVSGNSDSRCVKHFFCLAEKALEKVPDIHKVHAKKLIRQLHSYNEKMKDQDCVLNENMTCTLKLFLEDIINCSERCGTPKKKRSECENMKHKQ